MPKNEVRSPRKPRGESAKVTIANQANEIRTLIARVEQVTTQRDKFHNESNEATQRALTAGNRLNQEMQWHKADLDRLSEAQAELATLKTRFEGYRMGVRDALLPIEVSKG